MATKKKPANMKFANKTVSLVNDKTSPYVKSFVRKIDSTLQSQVTEINVPAFTTLKKNITVETFFMNHTDFEALLGKNVDLLDRMMSHAICFNLANDIREIVEHTKGMVGVWDQNTIYNILAAAITLGMLDSDTNEKYFTGLQFVSMTSEEIKATNEDFLMKYDDYNPNRFMQVCLSIRNVAIKAMAGIMENKIPSMLAYSTGDNPQVKIYNFYRTWMENTIESLKDVIDLKVPATEKNIRKFMDAFEDPFMNYVSVMLENAGLSQNVINLMLGTCKLHILFDDPEGKELGKIGLTLNLVSKLPMDQPTLSFATTIEEEFDAVLAPLDTMAKTRKERYGKKLRQFVLNATAFTANVYMAVIRNNKAETKPAKPEVEDIDPEAFSALLAGPDKE